MRYHIYDGDKLLTLREFDIICCKVDNINEDPKRYCDLFQVIIGCFGGLAYSLRINGKESVDHEIDTVYPVEDANNIKSVLYKYTFEFF